MPTLQNFLQGQHIVALTLQPLAADTAGVLTAFGAPENLFTHVDQISLGLSVSTVSIVPLTSVRANEVPIEASTRFSITEILKRKETSGTPDYNQLKRVWDAVMLSGLRYVFLTFTRGGPGGQYQFYALIGGYNESGRKEKNTGRMTFAQLDIGVANAAYTAA